MSKQSGVKGYGSGHYLHLGGVERMGLLRGWMSAKVAWTGRKGWLASGLDGLGNRVYALLDCLEGRLGAGGHRTGSN